MAQDDRTHVSRTEQSSALVHAKDVDDFKIPEGQPDPRGWKVKSTDGTTLGKVEDLLFDTGESRVRYIEVKADGDITKHGGRDYFLLPIGAARLDDDNDDVVVQMGAEELTGVPAYERGKMSREYETSLRDYVRERPTSERRMDSSHDRPIAGASTTGGVPGANAADREVSFYNSPEYDDASFFSRGRRRDERGLGDRIANAADDIKDRFDGNPASRPGPDATDRRY
jgi:hypothetical protein